MFKKLIGILLLTGALLFNSASAGWLGTGYQKIIKKTVTSSITLADDSTSCETVIVDTSNVSDWLEFDGSTNNIILRFRKDTIHTAAIDTYWVYIETSPVKYDTDSANLFQKIYTLTDASPSATNEYTRLMLKLSDSLVAYHRFWRFWFIDKDSVGTGDSATAGNTYEDTLDLFIENWE